MRKIRMLSVGVCLLLIAACAGTQENVGTKTKTGAAIGAATGALAGAVIGHQSGHRGGGAVIGGLAGAAIGGGIGYQLDQQAKELEQIPNTQVTTQEDRLVVTMSDAVLFDTNSAVLKPASMTTLDQMADVMKRYPDSDILVKGHTDNRGTEQYNQDLSERRAKAVKNYLILRGVAEGRMTAIGFGLTMPVADNATSEGRQKNRRVEIEIKPRPAAAG